VRHASAVLVMLVALSASCATSQRPEGVVERWLLSLNQGSAGAPDRYGGEPAVAAADAVLPDRRSREPGSLDRVEVGAASLTGTTGSRIAAVPFRIETTEGETVSGTVLASECGGTAGTGTGWCVHDARVGGAGPAEGAAWSAGADASDWGRAAFMAVVLSVLAVLLVGTIRRRSSARSG
jgi:hypothetical protein